MATPRNRYGYTLCPDPTDSLGLGYRASNPMIRNSRCTRLRFTSWPWVPSHAARRRLP